MAGDDFQRPEVDELIEINRPAKGIDFFVPLHVQRLDHAADRFHFLTGSVLHLECLVETLPEVVDHPLVQVALVLVEHPLEKRLSHRLHVRVHAEVLPVHEYSREVAARCRQARLAKQLVRQVLLHQRRILNVVVQRQPVEAKVAPSLFGEVELDLERRALG